jgi:hypothetical protein
MSDTEPEFPNPQILTMSQVPTAAFPLIDNLI